MEITRYPTQQIAERERGARIVDAMITNNMLPKIGPEPLSRLAAGGETERVYGATKDVHFAFAFH